MISAIEHQAAGADLVSQVEEIFSPSGILSKASNFEFRPQQQEMAVAVARALQNREHLAVEAGTGVGKSLAYLVPAILFAVAQKKKAVVSTHTINLQEQLTEKDLPMLAAVLGSLPEPVKFSYAMLKGRANYLCTRRLQKAMQQSGNLFTSSEAEELQRIYEWSKETKDGSLSDFSIEPDPKVWAQVCSERGLCSKNLRSSIRFCARPRGVLFSTRAKPHLVRRRGNLEPHAFFHAARRRGRGDGGRHFVQERLRHFRRGAHDGKRRVTTHRLERVERAGALFIEPAVESEDRKRSARHAAPGQGGEAGRGYLERVRQVF
jgi:ATP-dependent DNA helicase DinG